ncbi:hypothetical protein MIR68_007173 [Amoeboaphelidium protococcarum]|nr:hypothetical protein MIR68_007173 [Amoeboaphelidium protococcarum]
MNYIGVWLGLTKDNGKVWRDLTGRHVLISGGSKGLGKAVALECAKRGASVTILARNQNDLNLAVEEIKSSIGQSSLSQVIQSFSVDVTDGLKLAELVRSKISQSPAGVPSLVFACAGRAQPGLFLHSDLAVYEQSMMLNYMGAVNLIQPCVQIMVENKIQDAHVVVIASTLTYFGLIGYSSYSPAKFALRGFTESIRQELKPLNIGVHLMAPGGILSPGFEEENKIKPDITRKIEGDDAQTPEVIAKYLLSGLEKDQQEITSDWITDVARCVGGGIQKHNAGFFDRVLAFVGFFIFYAFGWICDIEIKQWAKQGGYKTVTDTSKVE